MPNSKFSSDILISLATAPLLITLVGGKALAEFMKEVGQASEEIFRGDRLPVLQIRSPNEPE
jgi:hypothetical protein